LELDINSITTPIFRLRPTGIATEDKSIGSEIQHAMHEHSIPSYQGKRESRYIQDSDLPKTTEIKTVFFTCPNRANLILNE